jgi:hypothetical protein
MPEKQVFCHFCLKSIKVFSTMTAGIQIKLNLWTEQMQIQPSDNWMNSHDSRMSQDSQYRKIAETEAVVNELDDRFATYTQKAMKIAESDVDLIDAARDALDQGMLDVPDNLQAAAATILVFGI